MWSPDVHDVPSAALLISRMYAFYQRFDIPAGATLAGYRDRIHVPTVKAGTLEVHGIGGAGNGGWQICAIDALYAGVLVQRPDAGVAQRIIAASHTHFAPMLDADKPALGNFSPELAALYQGAFDRAPREDMAPDACTLFVGKVDIPVYRRFDFPASLLNRLLTRYCGLYPNDRQPVDRNVYVFSFTRAGQKQFSIVYHACHPVTRHDGSAVSPDYISAIRQAVQERWGAQPCLFFLGCAGDIRPNLAQKRTSWLPRMRLNWKFRSGPSVADQNAIDAQYKQAVAQAQPVTQFAMGPDDIRISQHSLPVSGLDKVEYSRLDLGGQVSFSFLPFEVSHRYQLEVTASAPVQRRFIVSCAGTVHGYLPHVGQHRYGGYEVEGSRTLMGLGGPISMESQDLWPSR